MNQNQSATNRLFIAVTIAFSTVAFTSESPAGFGLHGRSSHHRGTASRCCPQCHYRCKFNVERGEEEEYCWKIEHDVICVPRVVFPWQKTCRNPHANNGAFLKTVKKLIRHEYTCPQCEYSWTAENICGADDATDADSGAGAGESEASDAAGAGVDAPNSSEELDSIGEPGSPNGSQTDGSSIVEPLPAPTSARRFWFPDFK